MEEHKKLPKYYKTKGEWKSIGEHGEGVYWDEEMLPHYVDENGKYYISSLTYNNRNKLCESCGDDDDVELVICPYYKEILGEDVEMKLCGHCYYERLGDI